VCVEMKMKKVKQGGATNPFILFSPSSKLETSQNEMF